MSLVDLEVTRHRSQRVVPVNVYRLLLTACCLLLTAYCSLPTAHCLLLTAYYLLLYAIFTAKAGVAEWQTLRT